MDNRYRILFQAIFCRSLNDAIPYQKYHQWKHISYSGVPNKRAARLLFFEEKSLPIRLIWTQCLLYFTKISHLHNYLDLHSSWFLIWAMINLKSKHKMTQILRYTKDLAYFSNFWPLYPRYYHFLMKSPYYRYKIILQTFLPVRFFGAILL